MLWGQSVLISASSLQPCTLVPISSSEQMAVRHRDVVLAHLKELGFRLNVSKVYFSRTENHLSGRGVGSDHDAGTYVPCLDRVNPHVSQESKRRPVTHCQAVSKTAGSDVSCVQRDDFWPAVHETPTVVAQDKGFSLRWNPLCMIKVTQRCLRALDMWRKPLVFVSGPGAGSSLLPRNFSDGCISHRLGSGHEWPPCPRFARPERSPCVRYLVYGT